MAILNFKIHVFNLNKVEFVKWHNKTGQPNGAAFEHYTVMLRGANSTATWADHYQAGYSPENKGCYAVCVKPLNQVEENTNTNEGRARLSSQD